MSDLSPECAPKRTSVDRSNFLPFGDWFVRNAVAILCQASVTPALLVELGLIPFRHPRRCIFVAWRYSVGTEPRHHRTCKRARLPRVYPGVLRKPSRSPRRVSISSHERYYFVYFLGSGKASVSARLKPRVSWGLSMSDWLLRDFMIFGITGGQNWMLIALAILAVGIVVTWWLDR
jgi:hypothetical protein